MTERREQMRASALSTSRARPLDVAPLADAVQSVADGARRARAFVVPATEAVTVREAAVVRDCCCERRGGRGALAPCAEHARVPTIGSPRRMAGGRSRRLT